MDNKPTKIIVDKVIGFKTVPKEFLVSSDFNIIYALGLGFNEDQLNEKEFKFTYELNDEFSVFPTYASVIPINDLLTVFNTCPGMPEINPMMSLHGEQFCEFIAPFPKDEKIQFVSEVVDLEDKGKGTVICIQNKIFNPTDNKVIAITHSNLFIRGLKGEGYKGNGTLKKLSLPSVPKTTPFKDLQLSTKKNQALIYRIGGNDKNPLHVDPNMSSMGGFEVPILHGLCFYGITAKAAYTLFCDNDVNRMKSFNARFTSHVIPGETLIVEFYKHPKESNKVIVSTKTKERGLIVLQGEFTLQNTKF